ncbi:MAG: RimK/LysX family protein [Candidatus Woesearchaeota archaeon]
MKTIIGLKEYVTIFGKDKARKVIARIDTGASKCSVDSQLAHSLGLGPVLREKRVKSAHGISTRGIILARIMLAGRKFKVFFTLADRKHMKYPVLIGRNILKRGFLIDPAKKIR